MCRNIKILYNTDPPSTEQEVHDAAVQFVRKITGFAQPSAANAAAFDRAVNKIGAASTRLLESLVTTAPRRSRAAYLARARARAAVRFYAGRRNRGA